MQKNGVWMPLIASVGVGAATFYTMTSNNHNLGQTMQQMIPLVTQMGGNNGGAQQQPQMNNNAGGQQQSQMSNNAGGQQQPQMSNNIGGQQQPQMNNTHGEEQQSQSQQLGPFGMS